MEGGDTRGFITLEESRVGLVIFYRFSCVMFFYARFIVIYVPMQLIYDIERVTCRSGGFSCAIMFFYRFNLPVFNVPYILRLDFYSCFVVFLSNGSRKHMMFVERGEDRYSLLTQK